MFGMASFIHYTQKEVNTMKTLKTLKATYAKVIKDLGIVKSKGIAQHVREYVLTHPTVSKSKARPIVVLRYKQLEASRVEAYMELAKHEDTLLTDQVFSQSACLRFRSRAVTTQQASSKAKAKAPSKAKAKAKAPSKAKAKAKK